MLETNNIFIGETTKNQKKKIHEEVNLVTASLSSQQYNILYEVCAFLEVFMGQMRPNEGFLAKPL